MDLIDRQDAIDALRTCYDTKTISMDNGDEYINYEDAIGAIEQLPSAQPEQPEIIRCKDCRWWDKAEGKYGYCMAARHCHYSTHWEISIYRTYDGEFFCADAERRKEDG